MCATCSPALRTSRPSPTHRIGTSPWPSAAANFAAQVASSSPWYCRRSECPTIDVAAAELGEHRAGDLAGVRARGRGRRGPARRRRCREVGVDQGLHRAQVGEGGQHGHLDIGCSRAWRPSGSMRASGPDGGLEVVQVHLPVARHERSASAISPPEPRCREGSCPRAARGSRRRRSRCGRSRASSKPSCARPRPSRHRRRSSKPATVDQGLRDGPRARGERRELEHAHRAVPDDRLRGLDGLGEQRRRLRADVQAHLPGRDRVRRHRLVRRIRRERVRRQRCPAGARS